MSPLKTKPDWVTVNMVRNTAVVHESPVQVSTYTGVCQCVYSHAGHSFLCVMFQTAVRFFAWIVDAKSAEQRQAVPGNDKAMGHRHDKNSMAAPKACHLEKPGAASGTALRAGGPEGLRG